MDVSTEAGMEPSVVSGQAFIRVALIKAFRVTFNKNSSMSKVIRRRWTSDLTGPGKRDRRVCEYEAYVPDGLVGRRFSLDGDVAADVSDAESAITRLNLEGTSLVDTEALARLLLRAEAVASSRIEGLDVGPRRLLHAEVARSLDQSPNDVTATEVLGNIDAMVHGIQERGSRWRDHGGIAPGTPSPTPGGHPHGRAWGSLPGRPELDRGQFVQPVLGCVRPATTGARQRSHGRSLRLLE